MASKKITQLVVLASFGILAACASVKTQTIRNIPQINVKEIKVPPMSRMMDRNVALSFVDNRRDDVKVNSEALKERLQESVTEALATQGINVSATAPTTLVFTVQDHKSDEFSQGCVKLSSTLAIPKKGKINAEANSCYELKSAFGYDLGADIGKAYEVAFSLVFKNLDKGLEQLP